MENTINKNISKPAQVILWNMFNQVTCELLADKEDLENRGCKNAAANKQALVDELDEIAKQLGII